LDSKLSGPEKFENMEEVKNIIDHVTIVEIFNLYDSCLGLQVP
jgi:hypothetical protein